MNGIDPERPPEGPAESQEQVKRFEVTVERQLIVYATDAETASVRALQLDGGTINRKVVEVKEVGPSGMDERGPLIDNPPKRPL